MLQAAEIQILELGKIYHRRAKRNLRFIMCVQSELEVIHIKVSLKMKYT